MFRASALRSDECFTSPPTRHHILFKITFYPLKGTPDLVKVAWRLALDYEIQPTSGGT